MLLTPFDIASMEQDVREIIGMWDTRLTVLKPRPIGDQPNWNELMHEYSGEIHYVQFDNVPMERKDQVITNEYTLDVVNGNGDQKDGYLMFSVSDLYVFLDETCRVVYLNEQWRIVKIHKRIGERLIILSKVMGSNEKWAETPDASVDVGTISITEVVTDPDLSGVDDFVDEQTEEIPEPEPFPTKPFDYGTMDPVEIHGQTVEGGINV